MPALILHSDVIFPTIWNKCYDTNLIILLYDFLPFQLLVSLFHQELVDFVNNRKLIFPFHLISISKFFLWKQLHFLKKSPVEKQGDFKFLLSARVFRFKEYICTCSERLPGRYSKNWAIRIWML